MSNPLEKIKSLAIDINKNYDIIDNLLKENKDIWESVHQEFGFPLTDRFSIMSEFQIGKYKEFLKKENLSEQYIVFITLRIVFAHIRHDNGKKADKIINSVKSKYFPFRFGSIGRIRTVLENKDIIDIKDYFKKFFGISLPVVIEKWEQKIINQEINCQNEFKLNIKLVSDDKNYTSFMNHSDQFLWPESNIFILDESEKIIPLTSRNRYRFQKSGKFRVNTNECSTLKYIAVHGNCVKSGELQQTEKY